MSNPPPRKPPIKGMLAARTPHKSEPRAFKSAANSPTLAFKLVTGNYFSYQYSHLMDIDFIPDEGIILRFTATKFRLRGRHLSRLFFALLEHNASIVYLTDPHLDDVPENKEAVTAIELLEGTHHMFPQ